MLHVLLDYLVSYEKRPLFPFTMYSTRGILPGIPDGIKEWTTAMILAAGNIILAHDRVLHWIARS
jgi:membrane-bound metal-dependent hydrolase YbcI (DUF457 family)